MSGVHDGQFSSDFGFRSCLSNTMSRHDHGGSHKRRRIDSPEASNKTRLRGIWAEGILNPSPSPESTSSLQDIVSDAGHSTCDLAYRNTGIYHELEDPHSLQPAEQESNGNPLQFNCPSITHPIPDEGAWNGCYEQQPIQPTTVEGQLRTEIVCFGMVSDQSYPFLTKPYAMPDKQYCS